VFTRSCCAAIFPLVLSVNRKPLVHSAGNLLFTPGVVTFPATPRFSFSANRHARQCDINNASWIACAARLDGADEEER
jgi:hypothetical protein